MQISCSVCRNPEKSLNLCSICKKKTKFMQCLFVEIPKFMHPQIHAVFVEIPNFMKCLKKLIASSTFINLQLYGVSLYKPSIVFLCSVLINLQFHAVFVEIAYSACINFQVYVWSVYKNLQLHAVIV